MGHFDLKNYVLNVKVKENLTDTRAVERMKAWDFTLKEWQAYIKAIDHSITNTQSGLFVSLWSMTRWTYVLTYMESSSL